MTYEAGPCQARPRLRARALLDEVASAEREREEIACVLEIVGERDSEIERGVQRVERADLERNEIGEQEVDRLRAVREVDVRDVERGERVDLMRRLDADTDGECERDRLAVVEAE